MARSVDDIDSISLAYEPMGPAFTSVDGSKKIQPLPTAAVDQDERPRVSQGLRNPVLDIHLAAQRWPGCSFNALAANPEEAVGGQRQTLRPLRVQISRSYRFDRPCHRASGQWVISCGTNALSMASQRGADGVAARNGNGTSVPNCSCARNIGVIACDWKWIRYICTSRK